MLVLENVREKKSCLVWMSAALFISISLFLPGGYSVGASLILLLSFLVPFISKKERLDKVDLILISSFLIYSFGMLLLVFLDGGSIRDFDKASRFVLAILPLILFLNATLHKILLFLSFFVSSLGALFVSFFDRFYLGLERAGGDFNPIMFGGFSLMIAVICLNFALYYYNNNNKMFFLSVFSFLAGLSASILSVSKGGWLALPIVIAFLIWNYHQILSKAFYLKSLISILVMVALIFAVPSIGVKKRINALISDVAMLLEGDRQETSVSHRTELWKASFIMFKSSPVFGIGKSNQDTFKQSLVDQDVVHKSTLKFNQAHNEYLNELGLRGILGLFLLLNVYLVPLGLFLRKIRKYSDNPNIKVFAIAGALVPICYMVFALTQAMFTHNSGVIMYAFTIVILWAATRWAEREERELGNIA
ncbi:O-antigen ligase family protein [Marinomonas sp. S3726]|uniref:O-antigen ligase family protein n=1 Tax=Marinomonas sp. S3726 TaxID=579484 RepID=UPI00138DD7B8|nr:O-antigen ligase family protein [Marinomonas sp. S3726]